MEILSQLITDIFKMVVMAACAMGGIFVGIRLKARYPEIHLKRKKKKKEALSGKRAGEEVQ